MISAWLIAPSGALLAGPVDIANTDSVDTVARLGSGLFLVAYSNGSRAIGQVMVTYAFP